MSFASAIHSQSVACHLRADTHGLIGGSSPAGRRGFNFSRCFQAPGSLFPCLHSALAVFQDSARQRANPIRSFSSLLLHARNMAWESKHEVHRKSASGAQSSE